MITISRNELQTISKHAEETYPEECCGFLLGVDLNQGKILRSISVTNASDDDRRRRYSVHPMDIIRADEAAKVDGLEVVGIYHSHPDSEPRPSRTDLDYAWPLYTYVIIAVKNKRTTDAEAWKLSEDRTRFEQVELKIEPQ